MEIGGIGDQISNAYNNITESKEKEAEFKKILEQAVENKDDEKLKAACQDFEAYFVKQLFKEMRKTVPEGGLYEKSNAQEIYEDMLDDEYSSIVSKSGGTGIGDALYRQMSKKSKQTPDKEPAEE